MVQSISLGVSSTIAQCSAVACRWERESDGTRRDDANTRAAARRHCERTGHAVAIQAVHMTMLRRADGGAADKE
jgi:hypothetical protein